MSGRSKVAEGDIFRVQFSVRKETVGQTEAAQRGGEFNGRSVGPKGEVSPKQRKNPVNFEPIRPIVMAGRRSQSWDRVALRGAMDRSPLADQTSSSLFRSLAEASSVGIRTPLVGDRLLVRPSRPGTDCDSSTAICLELTCAE